MQDLPTLADPLSQRRAPEGNNAFEIDLFFLPYVFIYIFTTIVFYTV